MVQPTVSWSRDEHDALGVQDVWFEPKAYRPEGPRLWFGGQRLLHGPVLRRLVRYGHGFHPPGRPAAEDMQLLKDSLAAAGRDLADLEMIGGTQAVFPTTAPRRTSARRSRRSRSSWNRASRPSASSRTSSSTTRTGSARSAAT